MFFLSCREGCDHVDSIIERVMETVPDAKLTTEEATEKGDDAFELLVNDKVCFPKCASLKETTDIQQQ